MPASMLIQMKKGRDGPSTLACVRADGTRTWAKLHPFFPAHDLTHCAVETVFGFDQAFFGLVASGWNIDDLEQPGAAARMPVEALWAEHMVGLLDKDLAAGQPFQAAAFSDALAASLSGPALSPFRAVTEAELVQVRWLRDHWESQWWALPPGATLEVAFPAAAAVT